MSRRMIAAIAALAITTSSALAEEVRVGIVLSYTGVGAEFAQQMDRAPHTRGISPTAFFGPTATAVSLAFS